MMRGFLTTYAFNRTNIEINRFYLRFDSNQSRDGLVEATDGQSDDVHGFVDTERHSFVAGVEYLGQEGCHVISFGAVQPEYFAQSVYFFQND